MGASELNQLMTQGTCLGSVFLGGVIGNLVASFGYDLLKLSGGNLAKYVRKNYAAQGQPPNHHLLRAAREREVEVARRKAAAAEENARTGRMRLELNVARSAMKMLPELRALLMDGSVAAEERIARALKSLPQAKGVLLLEAGKVEGVGEMTKDER